MNRRADPASSKPAPEQADAESRVLSAHTLFQGARTLVIEYASERYVLRITRHGKLILTK